MRVSDLDEKNPSMINFFEFEKERTCLRDYYISYSSAQLFGVLNLLSIVLFVVKGIVVTGMGMTLRMLELIFVTTVMRKYTLFASYNF